MRYRMMMIMLIWVLTSCSNMTANPVEQHQSEPTYEVVILNESDIQSEIRMDDFIYRLVTEKGSYTTDEDIEIYAELEYVGSQDEITIYHDASPFYFPITEQTRNYPIGYAMDQPLIATTLEKGESLREVYRGGGGYGEQDDPAYIEFMKAFHQHGFLTGEYEVAGSADFYVQLEKETGTRKTYTIEGNIRFEVTGEQWLSVDLECSDMCMRMSEVPFTKRRFDVPNELAQFEAVLEQAERMEGILDYGIMYIMHVTQSDGTQKQYVLNVSDEDNTTGLLVDLDVSEVGYSIPKELHQQLREMIYY